VLQICRGHAEQDIGYHRVALRCALEASAPNEAYRGIDDRFCPEAVGAAVLQAKYIASQMKGADLAPAVAKSL
jgi:hypothetical protein